MVNTKQKKKEKKNTNKRKLDDLYNQFYILRSMHLFLCQVMATSNSTEKEFLFLELV